MTADNTGMKTAVDAMRDYIGPYLTGRGAQVWLLWGSGARVGLIRGGVDVPRCPACLSQCLKTYMDVHARL